MRRDHVVTRLVFRGSVAFVAAAYAGYPAAALARARLSPRPWLSGRFTGSVSVIIAAHNEAGVIADKLRTVLDSPVEHVEREILLVDDGSDDDTAATAARVDGVRVLRLPRAGKAAALAAGVQASSGDVLVFTDANSRFEPGTMQALLAPFADPDVGGVAGDQRYQGDSSSSGERAHWSFDRALKRAESESGSVVSATGALYAIRREHFHGVPDGVTDDFFISTGPVVDGARLVFAPDALVVEPAAAGVHDEYGRKVRVMTRGLRGVWLRRQLLHPSHGFYAFSMFSRKVARRFSAFAIVAAVGASLADPRRSKASGAVALASATIVSLGTVGWWGPQRLAHRSLFSVPAFACMSVASALRAVWNAVTGVRIVRWEPER